HVGGSEPPQLPRAESSFVRTRRSRPPFGRQVGATPSPASRWRDPDRSVQSRCCASEGSAWQRRYSLQARRRRKLVIPWNPRIRQELLLSGGVCCFFDRHEKESREV